jgi:DNA repair protein RadD
MPLVLRDYQLKLKAEIYDKWNTGKKNVLAVMPTGAGKTRTFVSIAMDFAVHPLKKKPTAIMVHRKELVQQISLTLSEEGVIHNIIAQRSTIQGIIAAQRRVFGKSHYDYMSPITVISVDTLNARITQHQEWAKKIEMWITDEAAHLLKSNKWGRAVEYFPNAIGLGVTATPQRLDKRGLGSHADGVFDDMVIGPTTKWLIDNNYLSKYKIAVPTSDYQAYLKKNSEGADYSKEAMTIASKKSHIKGDVVLNYKKFADGKQAIVFTTDQDTGEDMEANFRVSGVKAKLLTSLSTDKERLDSLLDYQEKKIQVLINIDLFDEGLDVPGIECVIMARPTASLSKYLQMVGRGLRKAENKPYLILIDHVGNVQRHGLPCEERTWTLDRIVNRRDKVNLIRICANIACNAPYDRILTECPYCGTPPAPPGGGGGTRIPPEQVDGDLELIDPETIREMEAAAVLESPASIRARVAKATGNDAAGKRAFNNQVKRIQTQELLKDSIAFWAGEQRQRGLTDRQIHKKFYIHFNKTITQALGEPNEEMLETINNIQNQRS